jgi:hypothetical protein
MIEEEHGALLSVSFQSSQEVPAARGRLKDLARNGLRIEKVFEKPYSFYFISGGVNRIDPKIPLKMMDRFI